jgi:hypothetical protein
MDFFSLLPYIIPIFGGLIVILYVILFFILFYHWKKFAYNRRMTFLFLTTYLVVGIFLLGVAIISTIGLFS